MSRPQETRINGERYVSPTVAAAIAGTCIETMRRWCRTGVVPCVKVNPRVWWVRADFYDEWCAETKRIHEEGRAKIRAAALEYARQRTLRREARAAAAAG